MTRTFILENGQKPTEEQLKEIEEAQKSPIVFDEDCEELSPAVKKAFRSAAVRRNQRFRLKKEYTEMKESEKYVTDQSEWNLVSKEEVSMLKIKLGKSHRKESDWEVIKDILWRRNVLTFIPPKRANGLTTIEKVLCENGNLTVFTNLDDCTRHIQVLQLKGKFRGYVEIGYIPFDLVLDIADRHGRNVLIDVYDAINSKCFMYESGDQRLKAVIMAYS